MSGGTKKSGSIKASNLTWDLPLSFPETDQSR